MKSMGQIFAIAVFIFGSFSAQAVSELDMYNRVKGRSWSQLSAQEKKYAAQSGVGDEATYNKWKAQYEEGGSRASQVTSGSDTSSDQGIHDAAAEAMAAQKKAAMMNAIAGAALMATGVAGCQGMQTWGCPLIPMAVLAFAQSGHDSGAAAASGVTFDASETGGGGNNTIVGGGTPTTPTDDNNTGFTPEIQEQIDKAADMGYVLNPKDGTITNPDGTTTPTSAFSSPGAMAAAGMSQQTIDAAQKALAEAQGSSGASVASMGVETGGGGSGGAYGESAGSGSSLDEYFASLRNKKGDKERMIAGKSLTYGSDPIGVKMDNIFLMVHRRYQDKRKVNSYFVDDRAPASAKPNILRVNE